MEISFIFIDLQNWRDVIKTKVENRQHLHEDFFKLLFCGNQIREAAYWCERLDYKRDRLKPEWKAKLSEVSNDDPKMYIKLNFAKF